MSKIPNEGLSKEFKDGDVILGLSGCTFNCIEWHKNDGTFVKYMHNSNFSIIFGSHTGGDFDQTEISILLHLIESQKQAIMMAFKYIIVMVPTLED